MLAAYTWFLRLLLPVLLLRLAWRGALFIAGDYLLYKNFVTDRKTTIVVAEERIISFKKGALDNANKNLRERKAFLEKPTFPVVQNPF